MQHQHQHQQQTRREGAESVEGIVGENGCRAQVLREQARNLLSQSRLDVESRQERAGKSPVKQSTLIHTHSTLIHTHRT